MVYFDDIGTEEIIPEFKAFRTHAVAKQKPAPIIIYDYYDNCKFNTVKEISKNFQNFTFLFIFSSLCKNIL